MLGQYYRRGNILKAFQTLVKYDAYSKHDNTQSPLPLAAYYNPTTEQVVDVTELNSLPIVIGVSITEEMLKIIEEGSVTVTTAGVPVPLPSNTSAKAVIVFNGNSTGVIIMVGKGTVNAITDPPVGRPLVYPYSNTGQIRVLADSNEVYVDASIDGTKVTYHILG